MSLNSPRPDFFESSETKSATIREQLSFLMSPCSWLPGVSCFCYLVTSLDNKSNLLHAIITIKSDMVKRQPQVTRYKKKLCCTPVFFFLSSLDYAGREMGCASHNFSEVWINLDLVTHNPHYSGSDQRSNLPLHSPDILLSWDIIAQ